MRHDDDRLGEEPVDLTALWPDRDAPDRWASLAARIEMAAAPELARRAGASVVTLTRSAAENLVDGVVAMVARFAAPAFVAAAAAIVIAVATSHPSDAVGETASVVAAAEVESLSEQTVRQALGAAPTGWLGSRDATDAEELVRVMYAGTGQE